MATPSVFELCCGACPETTAHLLGCLCFQLLPLPAHQDFLLQHLNNTKPLTVSSFCPGPVVAKQLLYRYACQSLLQHLNNTKSFQVAQSALHSLCLPKSASTSEQHSHPGLAHSATYLWSWGNCCTLYVCQNLTEHQHREAVNSGLTHSALDLYWYITSSNSWVSEAALTSFSKMTWIL